MILPPVHPGIDYRHTTERDGPRRWKFELIRPVEFPLPWQPRLDGAFLAPDGHEIGRIQRGLLTIHSAYAWDGASPKRRVGNAWPGVPDWQATMAATLCHDFLYQVSASRRACTPRHVADAHFQALLRAARFPLAGSYGWAVRTFGARYWGTPWGVRSHAI